MRREVGNPCSSEGSDDSQARALLSSPQDSPEKRTYAWERNNEAEDAEIAALKAELDEQVPAAVAWRAP